MDSSENYIVYEVRLNGRVIYIGSGKDGRETHALSGHSHNVKLNELYFTQKENMEVVKLRENLTKEESLELEKEFIQAIDPLCNEVHVFKRIRTKRKKVKE